jgi:ketosteroid isomerase-like protein
VSADEEVLAAARALVDDFGSGRVEAYFARMAPEATFVFHSTPERLGSRAAYRELWSTWEREDGFRVLGCTSSGAEVQVFGEDLALVVHDVDTRILAGGSETVLAERETIAFARRDGTWLVVHEHLSPRG